MILLTLASQASECKAVLGDRSEDTKLAPNALRIYEGVAHQPAISGQLVYYGILQLQFCRLNLANFETQIWKVCGGLSTGRTRLDLTYLECIVRSHIM